MGTRRVKNLMSSHIERAIYQELAMAADQHGVSLEEGIRPAT